MTAEKERGRKEGRKRRERDGRGEREREREGGEERMLYQYSYFAVPGFCFAQLDPSLKGG
jgi:hypothetical protein